MLFHRQNSMKLFAYLAVFLLICACKKTPPSEECIPDNYLYYSDYFVFVADDGGSPLVIPMDVNWTPADSGYTLELKGWYGTTAEWPIGYSLDEIEADLCELPQESWEHANSEYFQFDASSREVISTIWEAPELRLKIPDSTQWVKTPAATDKNIYGCKTSAKVDGENRTGWLIYERIRRTAAAGSFGDFEAFYWIPIVVDGVFYHFEQHQGEQAVTKWEEVSGTIEVETVESFVLEIDAVSTDMVSGRTNIPDTITVKVPEWSLDIQLASGGSQVGHGPEFPNGLAYYRQSLLQSTPTSSNSGYGMLELILEDD